MSEEDDDCPSGYWIDDMVPSQAKVAVREGMSLFAEDSIPLDISWGASEREGKCSFLIQWGSISLRSHVDKQDARALAVEVAGRFIVERFLNKAPEAVEHKDLYGMKRSTPRETLHKISNILQNIENRIRR